MRTEAEVREALAHLQKVMEDAIRIGNDSVGIDACICIDLLKWMLGEQSRFQNLITDCRAIDVSLKASQN